MFYPLVIARHGQTGPNFENRFSYPEEKDEDHLTDVGIWQCVALRKRLLREFRFTSFFCGTLKRHLETAELLFPTHKHTWEVLQELNEKETPLQFAGRLGTEVEAKNPGLLERWHRCELDLPGAETQQQFKDRTWRALDSILRPACEEGPTLLVSSAWFICAMLAHPSAMNTPPANWFNMHIANTGITVLTPSRNSWKVEYVNDAHHLRDWEKDQNLPDFE